MEERNVQRHGNTNLGSTQALLSVVIALNNEADNIEPLQARTREALAGMAYELILGVLLFLSGLQLLLFGIHSEVMMHTYYASQEKSPYRIREIVTVKKDGA